MTIKYARESYLFFLGKSKKQTTLLDKTCRDISLIYLIHLISQSNNKRIFDYLYGSDILENLVCDHVKNHQKNNMQQL